MLVVNGIFLLENLDLEALSRDKVYEFALILQPSSSKGATGSTVAPMAVRRGSGLACRVFSPFPARPRSPQGVDLIGLEQLAQGGMEFFPLRHRVRKRSR